MLKIKENVLLKPYTTMALKVMAERMVYMASVEDLRQYFSEEKKNFYVLGGGSNVLFLSSFSGDILKIEIKGISVECEDDNEVILTAAAGENWHQFVQYALRHNYGGLENLSLIPGTVGAAPIQNIGAYGVEVKDIIHYVEAFNTTTLNIERFSVKDCHFAYRESVFKRKLKGKYIVTRVAFKLSKKNHVLHLSYGAIQSELSKMGVETPCIHTISDAVIHIRESKLPNPEECPNTGSFFKNPIIPYQQYNELLKSYPEIPSYPVNSAMLKIPAAWLIEKAGWKGKRIGNVGVHSQQALVIINPGGGTGKEVYDLSEKIIKSVQEKFGVNLEREVNVIS